MPSPLDVFRFAFGHRAAIQRVSGSLWSLPIGALLVATAAIARNYDQVSLWHAPERFLGLYGISLLSSVYLFVVLHRSLNLRFCEDSPSMIRQYGSFLGAFWMTAPIAWLYAIPVERWFNPMTAAWSNLGLLAWVSLWRVALMVRVASVMTGVPWVPCVVTVVAAVSIEFLVVSFFAPMFHSGFGNNLLASMAGLRFTVSPAEEVANLARGKVLGALPVIFVVFTILSLLQKKRAERSFPAPRGKPIPWAALMLSVLILIIACVLATPYQKAEAHWHFMESRLHQGEFEAALDDLERWRPKAFPEGRVLPLNPMSYRAVMLLPKLLPLLDADRPEWLRILCLENAVTLVTHVDGHRANEEVEKLTRAMAQVEGGRGFIRARREAWVQAGFGEIWQSVVAEWEDGGASPQDGEPPASS